MTNSQTTRYQKTIKVSHHKLRFSTQPQAQLPTFATTNIVFTKHFCPRHVRQPSATNKSSKLSYHKLEPQLAQALLLSCHKKQRLKHFCANVTQIMAKAFVRSNLFLCWKLPTNKLLDKSGNHPLPKLNQAQLPLAQALLCSCHTNHGSNISVLKLLFVKL